MKKFILFVVLALALSGCDDGESVRTRPNGACDTMPGFLQEAYPFPVKDDYYQGYCNPVKLFGRVLYYEFDWIQR